MRSETVVHRAFATTWLMGALALGGCNSASRNEMGSGSADSGSMSGQQAGTLGSDSSTMGGGMQGAGAGGMGAASGMTLDDAQIANVALTTNRLDSTSASDVVDRLSNAEAKSFARRMIKDHGAMMDSIRAVSNRLGSTAGGTNQVSTSFEQMAAKPLAGTGATLDRAYIENEVMMHGHVLRTIDDTLLPQVRDASLKALVQRMRTAVEGHLQNAEAIRARLGAN